MSNNSSSKDKTPIRLDAPLPEHLAQNLRRTAELHTKRVQAHQQAMGAYPHPDEVEEFDDVDLSEIHFPGKVGLFGPEPDSFRGGRRGRNRQQGQSNRGGKPSGGKAKKGGGSGGGRVLANPAVVLAGVQNMLAPLPFADMTGNVQIGEFNAEFLDKSKAVYFEDSYKEVVKRFHLLLLEEVDSSGVNQLASVCGYQGYCSVANTRNQAVGFLVHPRLKLVNGPITYSSIANVQGIPDLRPAFRLDLEDTVTGEKFSVVVLHLKSMRGGPAVTANVRYRQFALLVQDLGPNFAGIVGGDLNYKIDDPSCKEADPMIQAGYTLIGLADHSATQIMGSKIDGLFQKGLKVGVDYYRVFAFFTDPSMKRSFSDHATLKVELLVASAKSNQDKKTSSGASGGDAKDKIGGSALPIIVRAVRSAARSGNTGRSRSRKA